MPPDNSSYDYTQDPEFLSAPVMQQDAYLKANDAGYAAADPKTRGAYIAHIKGFDQPTQFEQQNTPQQAQGGTLARTARGIGRGLNNLVEGAYQTVAHPLNTAQGEASRIENQVRAGQNEPSTVGKIADYASALPFLGGLGKSLGDRAAGGDYAGAISEGLTTAVTPSAAKAALPWVRQALPSGDTAKDFIGSTLRTPEGSLKPWVRGASKLGGAFAGHATGIPEAGIAGYITGPEIANSIIPDNPITGEVARAKFMNQGYRPGVDVGTPQPNFLPSAPEDTPPLRPTVGTPEEWAAYEQRMKNLKAEASDAGTYSAARGKVGRSLNYQQRIGKNF